MAKGTFGERLKRERELREVSLEEVAKATRISERFLTALENEEWNKLPGGLFGRAFVRTTARYLGLDEEKLLGEYDLARGETSSSAPPRPEERIPSPPKWIPVAIVVGVLVLLLAVALGAVYAWHRRAAHRNASQASLARFSAPRAAMSPKVLLQLNLSRTPPSDEQSSSIK